jgi:hypothetical protein
MTEAYPLCCALLIHMQDVTQYEGAAYAQRMSEALAAAQPVGAGTDLRSTCDPNQPDHGERGDMMVRYADLEAYKAIAKQLPPMLGDSKVCGCCSVKHPANPGNCSE